MAGVASNDHRSKAHFTYIWNINYIPEIHMFESPEFTVESMEMTKWRIKLYSITSMKRMSCNIQRVDVDNGPESIELELEFAFLDYNGCLLINRTYTESFRRNRNFKMEETFDQAAILNETRVKLWPDPLTVRCRMWRTRTEISKSELCFASTHFNMYQFSCVMAIKEFSSLQHCEERTRILNSTAKGCPRLILSFCLAEENSETCVIHVEPYPLTEDFQIWAEISLLDVEGMVFDVIRGYTYTIEICKIPDIITFEKSKLMSDAAVLLSDDVLLLRCELLYISVDSVCNRIEDYKLMEHLNPKIVQTEKSETYFDELNETAVCPFKEIVNELKGDGILSDVCLRAGTKSFPVHKLILSSRSPVFRAMFTKDMREKSSNCIDIPDLDADTMNRLLLYIYEGKVQDLTWEVAANLYEAADKYELMDLKEKCSRYLKSNISESNVCEILVLSDMHHDKNLQKSSQEFVMNNSEIIYSDAWKVFRDNHSKLALETAEQIIYNMKFSKS